MDDWRQMEGRVRERVQCVSVATILYASRASDDDPASLLVCLQLRPTNVFSTTAGIVQAVATLVACEGTLRWGGPVV